MYAVVRYSIDDDVLTDRKATNGWAQIVTRAT
jgi:hypothetical protein